MNFLTAGFLAVLTFVSGRFVQDTTPQPCQTVDIVALTKTFTQPVPAESLRSGEFVPEEFQRAYAEAEKTLSRSDREALRSIPHVLITDRFPSLPDKRIVWSTNVQNPTGACRGIVIFAFSMHLSDPRQTDSERTQWMRRIFLHELGHVLHNWTDEYMKAHFGY